MQDPKPGFRAKTPTVSVILTVYKRTKYLPEALNSVLAQSYRDFEIIVADDSGTAASREIMADFKNDPQVRYLPNPTTLGIARSLVRAVEQARGEFIAILNDDDLWEKDFLQEMMAPLDREGGCAASFADHWVMDTAGQIDVALSDAWSASTNRLTLPGGIVRGPAEFAIANAGIPIAGAAVFRKDAVDWSLLVPEVSGAYDYWISCLLVASGGAIYYVPKRLARYRVHNDMETRRRSRDKGEDLIYIFTTMRQRAWFPQLDSVIKARLTDVLLEGARNKLYFGSSSESRRLFWRSFLLCYRPVSLAGAFGTFLPRSLRKRLWGLIGPVIDRRPKQQAMEAAAVSRAVLSR
jgi:glycosyltransferase involved in cell wall biosynthesis